MKASSLRIGYVASNLIAAFVTGADGSFDVASSVYSFLLNLLLNTI